MNEPSPRRRTYDHRIREAIATAANVFARQVLARHAWRIAPTAQDRDTSGNHRDSGSSKAGRSFRPPEGEPGFPFFVPCCIVRTDRPSHAREGASVSVGC